MLTYKVVERQNALTKQLQYYAQVSPVTPVTLDQIVELIEKRSTVTSADVKAVHDALQVEVRNALVDGKSVRLGDLGSFRPTLSSRSALSADAFLPANIKGVRVRYVPSAALKNDLKLDRVSLRNVTPAASGGDDEGGL